MLELDSHSHIKSFLKSDGLRALAVRFLGVFPFQGLATHFSSLAHLLSPESPVAPQCVLLPPVVANSSKPSAADLSYKHTTAATATRKVGSLTKETG